MGAGLTPAIRKLAKPVFWLVLALPAAFMLAGFLEGDTLAMDLLHPSGEMAVRLMLLALLIGPLMDIFGSNRVFRLWLRARRNLGVAGFCYAALHLAFYMLDMRQLQAMVDELVLPSIWTGWLSFAALLAAASISTDRTMRRLGKRWKQVQRLVYPAYLLAILHWLLLGWAVGPALVHLGPLAIAWLARIILSARRRTKRQGNA